MCNLHHNEVSKEERMWKTFGMLKMITLRLSLNLPFVPHSVAFWDRIWVLNIHHVCTVPGVRAGAQHSTGPDNRWALLFTLYPTCSIMTQRKRMTEGRGEEGGWRELRNKCKSRTLGVNLWPQWKCTQSLQLCHWTGSHGGRLNLAIPCVPVTGACRGKINQHKVAASPSPLTGLDKDLIRSCGGKARTPLPAVQRMVQKLSNHKDSHLHLCFTWSWQLALMFYSPPVTSLWGWSCHALAKKREPTVALKAGVIIYSCVCMQMLSWDEK